METGLASNVAMLASSPRSSGIRRHACCCSGAASQVTRGAWSRQEVSRRSPPSGPCWPGTDSWRPMRGRVPPPAGSGPVVVGDPEIACQAGSPGVTGNLVGHPITASLDLAGLSTTTRDGHLRTAISALIAIAEANDCRAVVIEDLDFSDARESGREHTGRRPSRGKRGRSFRRLTSRIPAARFRDRLVQMTTNAGLAVIAVDPAYTSKWGAEHWLCTVKKVSVDGSGHHAAALVIARRGLGQRARQRVRCASNLIDQVTQDRSGPPTGRDSVPLSV